VAWSSRAVRWALSLTVALAACAAAAPIASAVPAGRVLVTVTAGAHPPAGARHVAHLGGLDFVTLAVPRGLTARQYAASLPGRAGVVGAQADTPIPRASVFGTCADTPASLSQTIAVTANARSRPLPKTTGPIAVLDTGVDPSVPELAGHVLPGSDAVSGPVPATPDNDGHGTQVAAAAAGAPGLVAGVSPTSPVMPIRIATASLLATPSSIARGLEIAVTRKARVAVLPSSQLMSDTTSGAVTSLGLAIDAAFSAGVIVVVPAGNEGQNEEVFPGSLAHVLTVGSGGPETVPDPFSNVGPWIDLLAPGAALTLPAPPSICLSGYAAASGTSFAAGAVAGAVALIGAARPSLTTSALYDVVRRLATSPAGTDGFDINTGFGVLNVGAGLGASAPPDDPHEVDDNVYWLKKNPSAFPTYLTKARKTNTRASVSPGKDPQDVFKVALHKGELLRATVTSTSADGVLEATIWSRATGAFDMQLPSPSSELRDSSGFTQNPAVSFRATRAGTYYVAVFAPDWNLPGEQGQVGKDLAPLSVPRTRYSLTLQRSRR